jgi:hypothetical protein
MNMNKEYVNFTPERLKKFKKACESCNGDVFVFEGKQFLKSYAMYLIEYLDATFGINKDV